MNLIELFNREEPETYDMVKKNFLMIEDKPGYGVKNTHGQYVIPKKANLSNIGDGFFVLDIVAEKFQMLKDEIRSDQNMGKIPRTSLFSIGKLENIKSAYINPFFIYKRLNEAIYQNFLLFINDDRKNIATFDQFLRFFDNYIKYDLTNPILFSSFMRSVAYSLHSTGLLIVLNNEDKKRQEYLDDPLIRYFTNKCIKYRFSFLNGDPWKLIYRISPAGIDSDKFQHVSHFELDAFKNFLFILWKMFLRDFPFETIQNGNCLELRTRLNEDKLELSSSRLLSLYLYLRNDLSKNSVTRLEKKMVDRLSLHAYSHLRHTGDVDESIEYLQSLEQSHSNQEG